MDETVTVTCSVTKGDLPIEVWWTLISTQDGREVNLTTNDGVMITKTSKKVSVMTIESVNARHMGNYTCYSQNKAGTAQFSASLAINGDSLFTLISYF